MSECVIHVYEEVSQAVQVLALIYITLKGDTWPPTCPDGRGEGVSQSEPNFGGKSPVVWPTPTRITRNSR